MGPTNDLDRRGERATTIAHASTLHDGHFPGPCSRSQNLLNEFRPIFFWLDVKNFFDRIRGFSELKYSKILKLV